MSNIAGCPGINTETSGKEAACAGCPNQSLCSSKEFKPDTVGNEQVSKRLNNIKFKLIILSGKGGVGKSTVTTLLARTLANRQTNENFGILDLDICGPSQPKMLGVEDEQVHHSGSGWSPVNVDDNLCVMSIGFLLPSADNAVIWRGPKKNGMVKQFLSEVDWGDLNCLLFDTPPGTSDEHLSVFSYLAETGGKTAALIVTTPQEISLLDVRKEIMFCRKLNIDIVGVIENMSLFECGHCGKTSSIFPAKSDNVKSMCKEMNVNYLGNIPLHPLIGQGCDQGVDTTKLSEPLLEALDQICNNINRYFINDSE